MKRSRLKNGYHFQRPLVSLIVRTIDLLGSVLFGWLVNKHRSVPPEGKRRKILLCKNDHLGDLVLFLRMLPRIREICKHDELHLVVGSWAAELVEKNPYVDRVLLYDHQKLNRSGSPAQRFLRWLSTGIALLKAMRATRYDIACDFRSYPPVMIPLLFAGGVAWRVGFGTAGFGFLLNKTVPWQEHTNEIEHFFDVAANVGPVRRECAPGALDYLAAEGDDPGIAGLNISGRVAVLNPFGGAESKKWPDESWRQVIAFLVAEGMRPVMVGKIASIDGEIEKRFPGVINAVNRTHVRSLAALVRRASLVVSVDSFAAQLAVAFNRPSVVLMTGIEDPSLWYPVRANLCVVTRQMPCSPCFRPCETFDCMNIPVESVVASCRSLLD